MIHGKSTRLTLSLGDNPEELGFLGTEDAEAMHLIGTGESCWARHWHGGLFIHMIHLTHVRLYEVYGCLWHVYYMNNIRSLYHEGVFVYIDLVFAHVCPIFIKHLHIKHLLVSVGGRPYKSLSRKPGSSTSSCTT